MSKITTQTSEPKEPPSRWGTVLSALSYFSFIPAFLVTWKGDIIFLVFSGSLIFVGATIFICYYTLKKDGAILLSNESHNRVPVLPRWAKHVATFLIIGPIIVVGVVCWNWNGIFHLGLTSEIQPNEVVPNGDGTGRITRPVKVIGEDGRTREAAHGVRLVVTKASQHDIVSIESINVFATPYPITDSSVDGTVAQKNVLLPNYYLAKLRPSGATRAIHLNGEGKPIDGTVILDKEKPSADLRVLITGEARYYDVRLEIVLRDGTGQRKRLLHPSGEILVLSQKGEETAP